MSKRSNKLNQSFNLASLETLAESETGSAGERLIELDSSSWLIDSRIVEEQHQAQYAGSVCSIEFVERVLNGQGIQRELSRVLVSKARPLLEVGEIEEALETALEESLQFSSRISKDTKAISIVGPKGSGKTITALRLAQYMRINFGFRVLLIEIQNQELQGTAQLERGAQILEIPFIRFDGRQGLFIKLGEIIQRSLEVDFIIVDTPGFSGSQSAGAQLLCADLNMVAGMERMLVLSPKKSSSELSSGIRHWLVPGFDRVVLSKLDALARVGSVLELVYQLDKKLAFFSFGVEAACGLEPADPAVLRRILLRDIH